MKAPRIASSTGSRRTSRKRQPMRGGEHKSSSNVTEADSPPATRLGRVAQRRSAEAGDPEKRKPLKVQSTLNGGAKGPGRQSGPPLRCFLSRAGYGPGSWPPGVGPSWGGFALGGGRLPPKLHFDGLLRLAAVDDELDRVSGLVVREHVAEPVGVRRRSPVGLDDDVAAERPANTRDRRLVRRPAQAGLCCAGARRHLGHEEAARDGQPEELPDAGQELLQPDPEVCV